MESSVNEEQVLKCPICGAKFPDIAMICPHCGHLLDPIKLSPSIKGFIAELEEYDKLITSSQKNFMQKLEKLTIAERRKASLIEKFTFANDKKSILEALLFIKTKVNLEAGQKQSRKNVYWIQLWSRKAEQLYEKSQILLPGNNIAEAAYIYILQVNTKCQKLVKKRLIAGVLAILTVIAIAILYKPIKSYPAKQRKYESAMEAELLEAEATKEDKFDESLDNESRQMAKLQKEAAVLPVRNKLINETEEEVTYKSLTLKKFIFSIPDYWDEKGSDGDYHQFYAETGGKVAMLVITCTSDEDEVSLEALHADNNNMIAVLESWFDECEVTKYEDFRSDSGIDGILYSYKFKMKLAGIECNGTGKYLCFPSVEDQQWFFIGLNVTDNVECDYNDDFMKMLNSISKKS